jgi:hypothetical protein
MELHASQRLQGADERAESPVLNLLPKLHFQSLQPFQVLLDCPEVFLKDDLLGCSGTNNLGEPPEMRRVPSRSPCVPDIVTQEEGLEARFGSLQISHRVVAGSRQIADGFIFDLRDVDAGEVSRTHESSEL